MSLESLKNKKTIQTIFEGDNSIILPQLIHKYAGSVDCVYIDPPYNNGEAYNFYDDYGNHSHWMCEMSRCLKNLWSLISEDGSIWISIDDNELYSLKILCDELFNRNSYVATIIWQQRNTRENRSIFSTNHEYLLVYSPNPSLYKTKRHLLPVSDELRRRYSNPDNDPRGPWQSVSANVQDGHAVPSQFYTIIAPNGKKHNPPAGRCWVYNKDRMEKEIKANNIWFGSDGNGVPRIKKFLKDSKNGLVPETLWLSNFAGTNKDAKNHLTKLNIYDKHLFDTPKPEQLIKRILEISTDEGDLVLDAFLGSGTTTAVAHKMNRNYIGIEKSEDAFAYIKLRMEEVIKGEKWGISKDVDWKGGGSCSFIKYTDKKSIE